MRVTLQTFNFAAKSFYNIFGYHRIADRPGVLEFPKIMGMPAITSEALKSFNEYLKNKNYDVKVEIFYADNLREVSFRVTIKKLDETKIVHDTVGFLFKSVLVDLPGITPLVTVLHYSFQDIDAIEVVTEYIYNTYVKNWLCYIKLTGNCYSRYNGDIPLNGIIIRYNNRYSNIF